MPESEDRIAELYRSSKAGVAPPPELDARILAEAQRQLKRSSRLPWSALGAAATLVIGVGLAWFHVGVPPALTPSPEPASAPTAEQAPAPPPPMPASGDAGTLPAQRAMREAIRRDAPAAQASPKALQESLMTDTAASETVVPMDKQQATVPRCASDLEGASAQGWRDAITAARAKGDTARLDCLVTAFEERFGETVEND